MTQSRGQMKYQPGLDGLRAISVVAVLLYHAGFDWIPGGFFGVEVFFVVSGFLITSLLISESEQNGAISLRAFWMRRIRRLIPALVAVLLVVGLWNALWGNEFQRTQLRRDYLWGIFYSANWGQIFSKVEYFSGAPTLLRHLWSLGVEEQWYIVWPVVFLLLAKTRFGSRTRGTLLVGVAVSLMGGTAIAMALDWPQRFPNVVRWRIQDVDTHNFLYLSTFTRASGLVLGAGLAFLWQPWRSARTGAEKSRVGTLVGALAIGSLVLAFAIGKPQNDNTYFWILPLVTLASAALIITATKQSSGFLKGLLESAPLVAIGKRSYGLYLWSWPISVFCEAYFGSVSRFLLAMAITIVVSEFSYRFVETPIRNGWLKRTWNSGAAKRAQLATLTATVALLATGLGVYHSNARAVYEFGIDNRTDVEFATTVPITVSLPRQLVIVGDSTARALVNNLPNGVEKTFVIRDGSLEGCSVYSDGKIISSVGYTHGFKACRGWTTAWSYSAVRARASVALVMIGAWDVFDQEVNGKLIKFASKEFDERFLVGVQMGIDALAEVGVHAAFLEVPCMRPLELRHPNVIVMPERAMDDRVAHVNDLLRKAAESNSGQATFVEGPSEYCEDEGIATDTSYRWDGVHSYKLGANLTLMTITKQLLAIPGPN